ncbi:MAG: hypothetical protein O7D91_14010 [Planctomycetota bacterium]|nr:hypothetical protein [Planctomycetota bacterium]
MSHLVVLAGFVAFVSYVGKEWFFAPPTIQAYAEVQEIAIAAPRSGSVNILVRPGQAIKAGDVVAIISLPEPEMERRELEMERLRSEIDARQVRRVSVVGRLARQQSLRILRANAQRCVALANISYDAVRDEAETDYMDGTLLAQQAGDLAASLRARSESLSHQGYASPIEAKQAGLRELSHRLVAEGLIRNRDRACQLAETAERRADAIVQNGEITVDSEDPEEIQDDRLLGQIDLDVAVAQAALSQLQDLTTTHAVLTTATGTIMSIMDRTHTVMGDTLATVSSPANSFIRIQVPADRIQEFVEYGELLSFRISRTGFEGSAEILTTTRGLLERDRRLNKIHYIEFLAVPTSPLIDLVSAEEIEIIP